MGNLVTLDPCPHLRRRSPRCLDCGARIGGAAGGVHGRAEAPAVDGYVGVTALGSGGFGDVLRARGAHGTTILKVAHAGCEAVLDAEAAALAAIGPPSVPSLQARACTPDGRALLAIEDVGDDALATRMLGGSMSNDEIGELASRLLAIVAAIHRAGYIHGDLKPEHVRFRANGELVLIDLGAALPIGTRRDGPAIGSVEYMAPELFDRDSVADPRSDLYALGVIVHELVTGRVPFFGSVEEIRAGHRLHRPWIERHPGAAPPHLRELVSRLLSKRPEERPPLSRPDHATRPSRTIQAAAPPIDAAPTGPRSFHGRDRQLAVLLDSARAAVRHGVPALVTVIADAGLGKSRLAAELSRMIADEAVAEVVSIDAVAEAAHDATVRALLCAALGTSTISRQRLAEHVGETIAAETWPGVAATLDEPGGAIAAAPGAIRAALVRATGEALRVRAHRRPLCVILDDAHAADDAALDVCEYVTTAGELPIWVAVLARPDLDSPRPRWGERAERHERMRLGPLAAAAAAEMARTLLWPVTEVPAAVLDELVALAHGSPLLLGEMVSELRRCGAVRRHGRGDAWYLASEALGELGTLPGIESMVERELAGMGPSLAAYARLAALLGPTATVDDVIAVVGRLGEHARDLKLDPRAAIGQLRRRGLLRREGDELVFRHALVAEAVERTTADDEAVRIHRAALAGNADHGDEATMARRLHHALGAGELAHALTLAGTLAARAMARHGYVEADRRTTTVLELLDKQPAALPARLAALRDRASARFRLGRHDDALVDLRAAVEIAELLGDRDAVVGALLDAATVHDWIDELELSAREVERAAAMPGERRSSLLRARLLLGEGRTWWRRGDTAAAARLISQAIELASSCGDEGYEQRVIARLMLGPLEVAGPGGVDLARATFAALVAECERHHDRLHLAAALNNRRHVWIATGELDALLEDAERCTQIGRQLGILAFEYGARINAGEALLRAGRVAEARRQVEAALHIELRRSPRRTAHLLEIRLLLAEGRRDEAAARHQHLVASLAGADASPAMLMPEDLPVLEAVAARLAAGI